MSGLQHNGSRLRRTALGDDVGDILRTEIITGKLKPGSRLKEAAIADELGVSRGPVRDALRILETERLVTTQPRRGSSVATFSKHDVEEIYTLRAELEALAARWAAMRMDDNSLRQLETTHSRILEAVPDLEMLMTRDLEFHRLIVHLSGHKRVIEAWQRLEPQILFFRYRTRRFFEDSPSLAHRHDRTMRALTRGNPEDAAAAMRDHINDVLERILRQWPAESESGTPDPSVAVGASEI